ncbi:MAG: DUF86 domain-containing protein [Deltaproteobacteria bacterium]|jgi:uncharacterized protein with HEPN domain|nr:DUF86 domain-containing protein [Deltaproteobacteria bacterium]
MDRSDFQKIEHIKVWCGKIIICTQNINNSCDTFKDNFIYQDAISMALLQISKLSHELSEDFKKSTEHIISWSWEEVYDLRNLFNHGNLELALDKIWQIAVDDIPLFYNFCIETSLKSHH